MDMADDLREEGRMHFELESHGRREQAAGMNSTASVVVGG